MPRPIGAFPIRLVALDIDGTLVASAAERSVPSSARTAIRRVLAAGVEVVLVTGRLPAAALPVAANLGLTAPLATHHGAAIVSPNGTVLRHAALEAAVALDALAWAEAHALRAHLNRLDELVMAADDPRIADFERVLGVAALRVADLRSHAVPAPTKVMIGGDGPELPAQTRADLVAALGDRATVTSSNPRFVEVLARGVSKAAALRAFAGDAGIPLANVLAIGDDVSDLALLAEVGHPVAMPHAPAEVRAVAAHIAPPLADDGAASVLETLVLPRAIAR